MTAQIITRPTGSLVVHYLASLSTSGVHVTLCGRGLSGRGWSAEAGIATCAACIEADERKLEQQLADEAVARAEAIVEAALEAEIAAQLDTDPAAEAELLDQLAARMAGEVEAAFEEALDAERTEPARTLLVTQCSKVKLEQPAPAGEFYRGTLSTMGRAAVERIEHSHLNTSTAILSALHGLLEPTEIVAPYDVTWGNPAATTAEAVADQLVEAGVQRVVAFTSNAYAAVLEVACEIAGVELVHALAGCRGIFEQRGRLSGYRRSAGISSRFERELPDLGLVHAGPLAAR